MLNPLKTLRLGKPFRPLPIAVFALLCQPLLMMGQSLYLKNSLPIERLPQVVEVPLSQVQAHLHLQAKQYNALVAYARGQRVPVQIYASQPGAEPDTLLLFVQLKANERLPIELKVEPNATQLPAEVFGREAPERKDDYAWENQQVAYRTYGPALEATGEITSGIDVWSKRVPNLVINSFYKRDHEGVVTHNPLLSYHKDNGQGLDTYAVGPTRGCGGTAVYTPGHLSVSKNYTALRPISNGPIRFAFEVTYAPWQASGNTVTETKRIILDAGSHLNHITSTYRFDGTTQLTLAAGVAVHDGAEAAITEANHIASVWDTPQDPSAGRIATGLIAAPDQKAQTKVDAGHALLLFERSSGQPFEYYAGSGWSKANMPDHEHWQEYLRQYEQMLSHPIQIDWKR